MKIICPEYKSVDIGYFETYRRYSCIDYGHAYTIEQKKKKPPKIFLRDGHDPNEELVILIKKDLENRGHDFWFDRNDIKFSHSWQKSVTKEILESNRFLSFLSKNS